MKTTTPLGTGLGTLLLLATTGLFLGLSCTSGLDGADANTVGPSEAIEATNGRFSFDPCIALTDPITEIEIAGGVFPITTGSRERPVAFVAFVTQSELEDADDGTTDTNNVDDVFVAAVDCDSVDPRAFVHSIAGSMRHTRCVTCHQMNIDLVQDPAAMAPTAFATQSHIDGGKGLPPLNEFSAQTCKNCHFDDWLSPGPTFDLRTATTRNLFLRAQVPPGGMTEHFKTDPRVIWALDNGATPFGGAADDDHDGVDEPEDRDGVRRHVPGGKLAFFEAVDALQETADPDTGELVFSSAEDAVQDIVLVSRRFGVNTAANGASSSPSLVWVPEPGFLFDPDDPMTAGLAGRIQVAFQSDATNMVGGGANGLTDVFRVTIDVMVAADGSIDLVRDGGSDLLVSEAAGGGDASGNSTDPDVGADGQRIAFVSEAFDLVAGLPTKCRPEVFLWDEFAGTALVSHALGMPLQPGDEGAIHPDLSEDGLAVSFESDASDLVAGDTNGTRDVFYALWPALQVERASVPDGGGEFAGHATHGSISHVAGDVRVAFAVQDTALPQVVAVLCPDEVVVLQAVRDTHMRQTEPTTNFGLIDLYVGATGASGFGFTRSLLAFDTSGIPAGATINSATLSMVVNMVPSAGPDCGSGLSNNVGLHRLTADWNENQATWNQRMTGINWSAGGAVGNFAPVASASTLLTGTGGYMWSSAQLAADVQSWVDAGSNFGWLVNGSATQCTIKRIDSREDAGVPTLVVDYTPPLRQPAPRSAAPGVCEVYVRDVSSAITLNLNQALTPEGAVLAREIDVDGTPLAANGTNPVISPNGKAILFESMAQNLDVVRALDENREMDVVLVDLMQFESLGLVLPYTLSVTASGGSANGPSHTPRLGSFTPPTDAFPLGLALFGTQATNLGDSDPGDLDGNGLIEGAESNFMLSFLREGGGVIADFEAEPARQGMGRTVRFESRSSGAPSSFQWDFGDGTPPSSKRSPAHAYATPGLYTVTLTASGARGTDDRTRIEYVHVLDAVTASFTTTKDASLAPAQDEAGFVDVPFTDPVVGAIDDSDASSVLRLDLDSGASTEFPDEFRWTLRRVNAAGNPLGSGTVVSKEADPQDVPIDRVGLYDLTLEATGPGGAGTATQRIEVYQKVDASFTSAPAGSPIRGAAPLAVQFTDTSTGDQLDAGAHFWDFDDGGTSILADPMHSFAEGIFFVTLDVQGKGTDSDTTSVMPVIADGVITSAFSVDPRPADSLGGILAGEAIGFGGSALVDFTNLSANQANDPLFYSWSFGVGVTGQETVANPEGIIYNANAENVANYSVTLIASKTNPAPLNCLGQPAGTCAQSDGTVRVYPRPNPTVNDPGASFKSSPLRPPHTLMLSGTVLGDGVGTSPTYRWLRSEPNGVGATIEFATGLNVPYEFESPGQYELVLEVTTNAPGGTRQTVQSAPRTVTVDASTLTEWLAQAVQAPGAACMNCHKGANPPAGLRWDGTVQETFERIVSDAMGNPIFSNNCNNARRLIEPGDPANSVVYNVLLNPTGPLCPINMRINLPGSEADKDSHVDVLASWIFDNAPNN